MTLFPANLGAAASDQQQIADAMARLVADGRNLDNLTAAADAAAARLGNSHPTVQLARERIAQAGVYFGQLCDMARASVAEALRRGLITADQAKATERQPAGLSAAAKWEFYSPIFVAGVAFIVAGVCLLLALPFLVTLALFVGVVALLAQTVALLVKAGGVVGAGAIAILAIGAVLFFALSGRKGRA